LTSTSRKPALKPCWRSRSSSRELTVEAATYSPVTSAAKAGAADINAMTKSVQKTRNFMGMMIPD
jgi:hypothetical protein